jgi:ribosomal protein S18 acetylase RimI-like enzyme
MWIYRAPLSFNDDQTGVGGGGGGGGGDEAVPVGFVNLGRPTPNTIAIRGVMVSPEARGRGIAERMVSRVVRTYLVEARTKLEFSFDARPPERDQETVYGRKGEVCLFVEVENGTARRLYKRVGFEASEDRWGDFNLIGVEPGSW